MTCDFEDCDQDVRVTIWDGSDPSPSFCLHHALEALLDSMSEDDILRAVSVSPRALRVMNTMPPPAMKDE